MNPKTEANLAILAALLVLFSSMLNPIISVFLSIGLLAAFAIYKYVGKK